MIIGFIGSRGTVPTADVATVSFLVDNQFLFECPSEIIQAFHRFQLHWVERQNTMKNPKLEALGKPTLGKIKYIVLSHLHFDHWGGLSHILHRILLLEKEKRMKEPLKVIIPKNSTFPFQQRMKKSYDNTNIDFPLPDDEFFYRLLTIEVGESVRSIMRIIVLEARNTLPLGLGYSLVAKENSHHVIGSYSYKLKYTVTKLDVQKAKKMNIPFNRTLKLIEKSKDVVQVGTNEISRSDIFFDCDTILCYSGDTQVNSELFKFFKDCHILIHEATYLDREEEYHLDSHSDILSLIEEADNLPNLNLLVPIHFSIRYTKEEISNCLATFPKKTYKLINPIIDLIVQIEPIE